MCERERERVVFAVAARNLKFVRALDAIAHSHKNRYTWQVSGHCPVSAVRPPRILRTKINIRQRASGQQSTRVIIASARRRCTLYSN